MSKNQFPSKSRENRQKAIAEGKKTYESGTLCKKCGSYEKYVSNYYCKPCCVAKGLEKLNDDELMSPYRTKEKKAKFQREWREKNPDKVISQRKRIDKAKRSYYASNYRSMKIDQTPENADMDLIMKMYEEAQMKTKDTGVPYEVDHIVPLCKGGLHHQDNLRVITRNENRTKGGRLI